MCVYFFYHFVNEWLKVTLEDKILLYKMHKKCSIFENRIGGIIHCKDSDLLFDSWQHTCFHGNENSLYKPMNCVISKLISWVFVKQIVNVLINIPLDPLFNFTVCCYIRCASCSSFWNPYLERFQTQTFSTLWMSHSQQSMMRSSLTMYFFWDIWRTSSKMCKQVLILKVFF